MAIQQVGGRGVYVITGSGRDPRKASNGQSWADLVTQQKFMLIQEAQKEALRQIEQEQLSFEDKQKRKEEVLKNLRKQLDNEKKSLDKLRLKGLGVSGARSNTGGRTSTTLSIPTRQEVISDYTNVISRGRANVNALRAERAALKKAEQEGEQLQRYAPSVLTSRELSDLQTYDDAIALVDKKISDENQLIANQRAELTEFENTLESQLDAELRKRAKKTERTSSGGGGGGGVSLAPEISEREKRIKDIQQEIEDVEFGVRPKFDTTERMRQIARDDFGLGIPREPRKPRERRERDPFLSRLFKRNRAEEMDVLGVQPEEEVEPTVEPTVEPSFQEYTVQAGDTLGSIADQYYGDPSRYTDIATASDIQDPNRIDVGQILRIPQDSVEPTVEQPIQSTQLEGMPTLRPQPTQTEIGDALRESYPSSAPSPAPALTPSPAPTPLPLTPPQGQMLVEDMLGAFGETTPQRVDYQQSFSDVQFGTPQQKQRKALEMIMEASQRLGPSNPQFQREKAKILQQLQKVMDPSQFRKQRKVERIMDKDPKNYMALAGAVRGLTEQNARLVTSLFPVSSDMKMKEIDKLYKSAQKEIATKLANPQRKKALELLELQYIAVLDDYNA